MTPSMNILTKSALSRSEFQRRRISTALSRSESGQSGSMRNGTRPRTISSPACVDLSQQFELIEIAVHVVKAGDAERRAIGECRGA